MKISNIDVDAALANVRQQLKDDSAVSPSLRAAIELLMVLIQILLGRVSANSSNSSKPPSQDPNRPPAPGQPIPSGRLREAPGLRPGHQPLRHRVPGRDPGERTGTAHSGAVPGRCRPPGAVWPPVEGACGLSVAVPALALRTRPRVLRGSGRPCAERGVAVQLHTHLKGSLTGYE